VPGPAAPKKPRRPVFDLPGAQPLRHIEQWQLLVLLVMWTRFLPLLPCRFIRPRVPLTAAGRAAGPSDSTRRPLRWSELAVRFPEDRHFIDIDMKKSKWFVFNERAFFFMQLPGWWN
jgi:hypothetical protein